MRARSISESWKRPFGLLLALLLAVVGFAWLPSPGSAYAQTATIEHSGEWLDFYQTKIKTGSSFRDELYTINGEFTFCIDITTGTVAGATYWSEDMDPAMALKIGLYDRFLQEEHPSWDYHLRYGYLQYMIWCEYSSDYMEENFRPEASDFWDVYAGAQAYYERNKDSFEAEGTAWYSEESQSVCIMPRLTELGGVTVRKADRKAGDAPQGDATLAGAVFKIVNSGDEPIAVGGASYAPGAPVRTIEARFDGETGTFAASCTGCLPCGSYELREAEAPAGYRLDGEWRQRFSITHAGEVVELTAEGEALADDVIRGGVRIQKDDRELGASEALGGKGHSSAEGACLAGIEFAITNQSRSAVLVGGQAFEPGEIVETLTIAWDEERGAYCAETSGDELPYGTYSIQETASNASYLLTDGEPRVFQIREDGVIVEADILGSALVFADQVVRNDAELSKKATDTSEPIQAAFLLTNTETGEAHVLVCDRNGDASTAASWNPHTRNTNSNDALLEQESIAAVDFDTSAGIWFGLGEDGGSVQPDDELGALPYGHYLLQELRSDSNEGYALVEREIWISRDSSDARSAWMSLGDQPSERIRTQAHDAVDGDDCIYAGEQAIIIDTVSYENLRTDGRAYTLVGTLMLKSANAPLLDAQGNRITSVKTFVPAAPSGTVELEFAFDASVLAGDTVVVFEDLLFDDDPVARHADIDDEGQSIKVYDKPFVPEEPKGELPKTGDCVLWIPIACLAGAAACSLGVALLARRRSL